MKTDQQVQDEIYRVVGEEIARKEYHPGPMARAVAEAQGNRDLVQSLYIKFRYAELSRKIEHETAKEQQPPPMPSPAPPMPPPVPPAPPAPPVHHSKSSSSVATKVVAVIGIIIATGLVIQVFELPHFVTERRSSQTNTCRANLKQIYGAIELAHMQGSKVNTVADLVSYGLLRSEPKCAIDNSSYIIINPGTVNETVSNCPNYDATDHPASIYQ